MALFFYSLLILLTQARLVAANREANAVANAAVKPSVVSVATSKTAKHRQVAKFFHHVAAACGANAEVLSKPGTTHAATSGHTAHFNFKISDTIGQADLPSAARDVIGANVGSAICGGCGGDSLIGLGFTQTGRESPLLNFTISSRVRRLAETKLTSIRRCACC